MEEIQYKNKTLIKLKEGVYWTGKEIIYPIKKDITKPYKNNLDWKNLIGIRNMSMLLMVIIFFSMIFFGVMAYKHDTNACFNLIENPQLFCSNYNIVNQTWECTEELEKQGMCIKQGFNESLLRSILGKKEIEEANSI